MYHAEQCAHLANLEQKADSRRSLKYQKQYVASLTYRKRDPMKALGMDYVRLKLK